jgi:hypothetical protein
MFKINHLNGQIISIITLFYNDYYAFMFIYVILSDL